MKKKISVIVPFYRGYKYLDRLKIMISEAAVIVQDIADIEWIISNDDPDSPLSEVQCVSSTDVIVINTDCNRGIQGARVIGLNASSGDYVLFLDQDDIIRPKYFLSQMKHIGDADAVVCDALNDNLPMYPSANRTTLEECITREFNISVGCGFYPGQVLVRKDKIPSIWCENWLKWNSCDDYYLWLCMYANDCIFKANPDLLYEHTISGSNQGSDGYAWYRSTMEFMDIIEKHHLFSPSDEGKLIESVKTTVATVMQDKNWLQMKYSLQSVIIRLYENGIRNDHYINCCTGLAIYGYKLGSHVYELLSREGFFVECIIDRSADKIRSHIPIYTKEEIPSSVSFILNTVMKDEDSIREFLRKHYPDVKVVNALDFLNELL